MAVIINGYLTQYKLESALKEIIPNGWKGSELRVPGTRKRWDMAITINDRIVITEFDGDEHYRNALKIKNDIEKDAIAASLGYKVVRIPYWVQLTTQTLSYYFNVHAKIKQNFPHGFITTKIFPASFCPLGLQRFHNEINLLPCNVRDDIAASLQARSLEYGSIYVNPLNLFGAHPAY